eukprot:TRINITY_DN99836_c0_g1_i1.p1 TRINITY_DN99836_c0_g1~~TRINITY_DN99836_c0_g1_i1.p1  ORF type:complete len:160 (-),score=61.27 TRINITY_DN99836_c0_g1_i1:113-592(-)
MNQSAEVLAARAKLAARMGSVQTGGSGSMRRTKKKVHANTGADDKQLQAQLKRLGCNSIPGIEEVNMFKDDGNILHFSNPKVQASVTANTFVVSGNCETKGMEELLPGIISQLGAENLGMLKSMAESLAAANKGKDDKEEGGDADIPDIGENFEEVSKQ